MKTIREILGEYEALRARREQLIEKRRREEQNSPVEALRAQKNELLLAHMKAALDGEAASRDEVIKKVSEIDEQLTRLGKTDEQFTFRCEKCSDTGFVYDGGKKDYCACLKRRIYVEVYGATDLGDADGSFGEFREDIFTKNKDKALRTKGFLEGYAKSYPNNEKKTVTFMGYAGLGKTFLLGALAKASGEEDVMLIDAFQLFDDFHQYRIGNLDTVEPIFRTRLLMVDDLGTEQMTTNVTREYMFRILQLRQKAGLHTFFATNLDEKGLLDRYTEKVMSRMLSADDAFVIRFEGEDLRAR